MWKRAPEPVVAKLLKRHFGSDPLHELVTASRRFPITAQVDLQVALDQLLGSRYRVLKMVGVHQQWSHESVTFPALIVESPNPVTIGPLQYVEMDLGEVLPARCLEKGLWLGEMEGQRFAVLLSPAERYGQTNGVRVEVAVRPGEAGLRLTQNFLSEVERAVSAAGSYRGKVLSLEGTSDYSGQSTAIKVHKLRAVTRDEIVLPEKTLRLLERNVMEFAAQRARLRALQMSAKKGLLFHGPPGTGKTHTIHYLAGQLSGHTTLLVTAGQVALLAEYMQLARFLQPAIVVFEDVDLIARDRAAHDNPCSESLLNQLLNEMDGLREDAEIFFILTTNRPQDIEAALASRPGRVDQAIEFPLPDEDGRRKLIRLYARGLLVSDELVAVIARKTEGGSAALIKELMRRAAQSHLRTETDGALDVRHVEEALDEMVFSGGRLNLKLLGGDVSEAERE